MKRELGIIIGTRQLFEVGKQKRVVTVTIGRPQKVKGDWACPFQISGVGMKKVQHAHGVDSMQALIMAIEGIRSSLEKSGKKLCWTGGELGETGFTRFVPTFFGLGFSRRLDRLIDQEVKRFSHQVIHKYRSSGAKRAPQTKRK